MRLSQALLSCSIMHTLNPEPYFLKIMQFYSSRPGLNTLICTLSLLTGFFSTGPNLLGGHKIYVTLALMSPIGT